MARDCGQELCANWGGDGRSCPCVLLDLEGKDRPIQLPCGCVGECEGDHE